MVHIPGSTIVQAAEQSDARLGRDPVSTPAVARGGFAEPRGSAIPVMAGGIVKGAVHLHLPSKPAGQSLLMHVACVYLRCLKPLQALSHLQSAYTLRLTLYAWHLKLACCLLPHNLPFPRCLLTVSSMVSHRDCMRMHSS